MKLSAVMDEHRLDERTRDAVLRLIHGSRALTAAALADQLNLSQAGVRRHLDALVSEGLLIEVQPHLATRGRGRPARAYALTDAGRAGFPHAYDDLAATALRYLRETGGEQAVTDFAQHRAAGLASKIEATLVNSGMADRVQLVAGALTEQGYAATVTPAGGGTQICQHHCPVAHVAAEFPELCAAETHALAEVLGTYVQRLATIAHGDGVCTTYIPSTKSTPSTKPQLAQSGGTT